MSERLEKRPVDVFGRERAARRNGLAISHALSSRIRTQLTARVRPCRHLPAVALAALSACASAGDTPYDTFELANIRPSNVIPKSSPASLVGTFRKHCLANLGDGDATARSLVAADYVENRRARTATARGFVVDDRRPAVMVSDGPDMFFCSVIAESRTGQTTRSRSFVAQAFPGAREVDPKPYGRDKEAVWIVSQAPATLVFLSRSGSPSTPATFALTIGRKA